MVLHVTCNKIICRPGDFFLKSTPKTTLINVDVHFGYDVLQVYVHDWQNNIKDCKMDLVKTHQNM